MSMEKDTRETTVDTFDDDMSAERAKKRQRHGVPSSEKADGAKMETAGDRPQYHCKFPVQYPVPESNGNCYQRHF